METRSIHTGTYGLAPADGGMFVCKAIKDENLKSLSLTHLPLGLTLIMPVGYRPEFSNSNTLNRDLKVQSAAAPTQTMMGKNSYEDVHVSVLNMGADFTIKRGDVIAYMYVQKTTKLPPAENLGQISVVNDIRTVPSNVISYLMTMYNADFDGMIKTYFTESTSPDNLKKFKDAGANLGCQQLYDAASAAVKDTINHDFQEKKKFSMQPRVVTTASTPIESHVRPKKHPAKKEVPADDIDDISDDEPAETEPAKVAPETETKPKPVDFADLMSSDDDEGKPVRKAAISDDDNVEEPTKPAAKVLAESDSDDEPVAKPAAKPAHKSAPKSAAKPAPKAVESDSEDEPAAKPAFKPAAKPAPKAPAVESDSEDEPATKSKKPAAKATKPAPVAIESDSDDEPAAKPAVEAKRPTTTKLIPGKNTKKPNPKPADDSDNDMPPPKKPTSDTGKSPKPQPKYVPNDSDDDLVQTPAALAAIARAKAAATAKAEKAAAELAAAAAEFTSSDTELAAVEANSSSDDDSDDSEGPGTRKPVAKPAARAIVPPRNKGPSNAFVRKSGK